MAHGAYTHPKHDIMYGVVLIERLLQIMFLSQFKVLIFDLYNALVLRFIQTFCLQLSIIEMGE